MSHYDEQRDKLNSVIQSNNTNMARTNKMLGELPCKENQSVRLGKELLARREMGLKKYGTSLENAKLTTAALLQHAKEEALDLAEYLQTLIDIEKRKGR